MSLDFCLEGHHESAIATVCWNACHVRG